MFGMARRWHRLATVGILCSVLEACGGADGARYTLDFVGTFAPGAPPGDDLSVSLRSYWSYSGLLPDESDPSAWANAPIGPWAPASEANNFTFSALLEVTRPDDGHEPTRAAVTIVRPDTLVLSTATVTSHDVGEEDDGWFPVHVTASFDVSHL